MWTTTGGRGISRTPRLRYGKSLTGTRNGSFPYTSWYLIWIGMGRLPTLVGPPVFESYKCQDDGIPLYIVPAPLVRLDGHFYAMLTVAVMLRSVCLTYICVCYAGGEPAGSPLFSCNKGWGGYTWNRSLFADPVAFQKKVHARGLSIGLTAYTSTPSSKQNVVYV